MQLTDVDQFLPGFHSSAERLIKPENREASLAYSCVLLAISYTCDIAGKKMQKRYTGDRNSTAELQE